MKKVWFRAKSGGIGWTPASWQGWTITLVYAFFLVSWFLGQNPASRPMLDVLADYLPRFLFLTSVFVFVAYRRGELPNWHVTWRPNWRFSWRSSWRWSK